jgi:hypothetical protein
MCRGAVVSCTECHTSAPEFNPYGVDVAVALDGADYETGLPAALRAVESNDSDGDGISNIEEILLGTKPGDANSNFVAPPPASGERNTSYNVGAYDVAFALRRMTVAVCGTSPTLSERSFVMDASDPRAALHQALDACLRSPYWLKDALPRLADKRVRPLNSLRGDFINFGDFDYDYRLFVHALSGDRDMRDLLLADYHVEADGSLNTEVIAGFQPVPAEQRAGMVTTRWFLAAHTMFSELPRTTAAQAYRAYLGQDIARSEGLLPVPGEPLDVDNKGVAQETCAQCHATLDPLSYAFASYNGLGGRGGNGAYNPGRVRWDPTDVTSAILDAPLPNEDPTGVRGWATEAANSALFRRTMAEMLFTAMLGRPVEPDEQDELAALEDGMAAEGHRAETVMHHIIDTDAFGVP